MADLFRFETNHGPVLLDLELVCAVWLGKEPDTTVLQLSGMEEPVAVNMNFEEFVNDWVDHTDPRPKKKKPRKVKRGSVAKVVALKS